jgi:hypothetical protein
MRPNGQRRLQDAVGSHNPRIREILKYFNALHRKYLVADGGVDAGPDGMDAAPDGMDAGLGLDDDAGAEAGSKP